MHHFCEDRFSLQYIKLGSIIYIDGGRLRKQRKVLELPTEGKRLSRYFELKWRRPVVENFSLHKFANKTGM